jgi:signal transduction histidine kinase
MRAIQHLVWPVGLVLVVAITSLTRSHPATTYGGAHSWLLWSQMCAALALLAAGTIGATTLGRAALQLAGALWLIPEIAGWVAGPAELRTVADASALLLPAVVVVAVVQLYVARFWATTPITVLALVGGALAVGFRMFVVDPFTDARCWRNCGHNPLLLARATGIGSWLERCAVAVVMLAAVAALVAVLTAVVRDGLAQVGFGTTAAASLVVGEAAIAALRLGVVDDGASTPYLVALVLAQLGAVGFVAALASVRWREWRLGVRLTRLALGLQASPAPGALTVAIGRAVGDAHLQVLYWAAGRGYIDADGNATADPSSSRVRRVTPVARRGQRLAAFVHSVEVDGDQLDRALGSALRLSLENEGLRAAALAELAELRSSRVRIVEGAAQERRRLERNLHDGAQQRVVSLTLLLRMLRNQAPPGAVSAGLARAEALTKATLDELRRVARGIYPAVLADAGLAGAVLDLAEASTDVAVQVDQIPKERYGGTVETTAYLTVAAAIVDAQSRRAGSLSIGAHARHGVLVVDVFDDRAPNGSHAYADLVDQVGALGGRLLVEPQSSGTHVRLELPCGS